MIPRPPRTDPNARPGLHVVRFRLVFAAFVAVFVFLVNTCSYYRSGLGFTALIGFSESWHSRELPAVKAVPHYDAPDAGYDGRFYVQMAVDPLLRAPEIDHAL